MKRLVIFSALLILSAVPVRADGPNKKASPPSLSDAVVSPGELKATPEMWFYDQELRQYRDPKVAVRIKADLRADQRQRRLESMKWFGLSNARPRANSDPFHGDYSPQWAANPGAYPLRWSGMAR